MLKSDIIAAILRPGEAPGDNLVISPMPDLEALAKSGAASVDLHLGRWFRTLRQARMTHVETGENTSESEFTKLHYVPFAKDYVLHPQAFVLATTLEWVRLPANLAGYVVGRSTWGRRGLVIATAIVVHPGFAGCLTLEMCNVGEIPISVQPGTEICQLCLQRVETASGAILQDKSVFAGRRRPILGRVRPDEIAQRLRQAYQAAV